jgi:OmpA-OmpF porin, OOP family
MNLIDGASPCATFFSQLPASSQAAFAASAEDAAYSKEDRPVVNSFGNCVRTKWMSDSDACAPTAEPKKKPPVVVKQAPTPSIKDITKEQLTIYFDFNSAKLTGESVGKLATIVNVINKSSEVEGVKIHGFTDQFGTDSYNAALAEKRAATVRSYITSKSRLKTVEGDIRGLGKSEAEADCGKLAKRAEKITCMKKERRVEIEFDAKE